MGHGICSGYCASLLILWSAAASGEAATIENHLNLDPIFSFPSPSSSLQLLFAVTLSSALESPEPAGAWLPARDAETLTLIYILVNCLHPLVSSSFSLLKMQLLLMSVNETHLKGIAPGVNLAWVNNREISRVVCPHAGTLQRQPRRFCLSSRSQKTEVSCPICLIPSVSDSVLKVLAAEPDCEGGFQM